MAEQSGESTQALRSWWAGFKKSKKKPEPPPPERLVFGVPLQESIKYANVAISLMNERGESFIYGYVPIVVAKCGVFLKEKATDVEGIFRLSGSAKRINELKLIFDSPPKYGKGLDWTGYTVHDAANVFRRYLNMLTQPIVPLEFYERFRDPLRGHQNQPVGDTAAQAQGLIDLDHDKAIVTFQKLITEIPDLNRQLLLYILDLLSVFASKADVNRMTSANLAAIFQPGMLSHPDHNLSPPDYRLSQDVILFLIDNQDSFLIGMSGTAADEQTVRAVQNAAAPPYTPSKGGLGRSVSNASGGADSVRKLGVRRNISVSSKNSKHSSNVNTPNTPQSGGFGGAGVHRSNTVPSKRSPALPSSRVARGVDSPTTSVALSPAMVPLAARHSPTTPAGNDSAAVGSIVPATPVTDRPGAGKDRFTETEMDADEQSDSRLTVETPPNKRRVSGMMNKNPSSDGKDKAAPNKLRKRRIATDSQRSANSSSHSLTNAEYIDSLPTPNNLERELIPPTPPRVGDGLEEAMGPTALAASQQPSEQTLKAKSPTGSLHSKSSVTDLSEQDQSAAKAEKEEKKRRWRFSSAARKHHGSTSEASPHRVGGNNNAGKSMGSMVSGNKSRGSFSNDGGVQAVPLEAVSTDMTQPSTVSEASGQKDKDAGDESDQKRGGLFGRLKAKVERSREERKEKEAEKERAKSPPRGDEKTERSGSKQSLSAIAHDILPARNRSIDVGAPAQPPIQENATSQLPVQERSVANAMVPKDSIAAPLPTTQQLHVVPAAAPAATAAPAVEYSVTNTASEPTTVSADSETTAIPVPAPATFAAEPATPAKPAAEPAETSPPVDFPPAQKPIAEEPEAEKKVEEATTAPTQQGPVEEQTAEIVVPETSAEPPNTAAAGSLTDAALIPEPAPAGTAPIEPAAVAGDSKAANTVVPTQVPAAGLAPAVEPLKHTQPGAVTEPGSVDTPKPAETSTAGATETPPTASAP